MAIKSTKITDIPDDYTPTENEEYMNKQMREYFRRRLLGMLQALESSAPRALRDVDREQLAAPDDTDRATALADLHYAHRQDNRDLKHSYKIKEALRRIESDDPNDPYGYCEESGEPIGVARMMVQPAATRTLDAQRRHEAVTNYDRNARLLRAAATTPHPPEHPSEMEKPPQAPARARRKSRASAPVTQG